MGKQVYKYPRQDEHQIEQRASTGIGTIVKNNDGIDVTNITISDIGNTIGTTSRALFAMSSSAREYSWFGPYEAVLPNDEDGYLFYRLRTKISMGDYGGYNHGAIIPKMAMLNIDENEVINYYVWEGDTYGDVTSLSTNLVPHFGELDLQTVMNSLDLTIAFTCLVDDGTGHGYIPKGLEVFISDYTTDEAFDTELTQAGDIRARIPFTIDKIPPVPSTGGTYNEWKYKWTTRHYPGSYRQHLLPDFIFTIRKHLKVVNVQYTHDGLAEVVSWPEGTTFLYKAENNKLEVHVPGDTDNSKYIELHGSIPNKDCKDDSTYGTDSSSRYYGKFSLTVRWWESCTYGDGMPKSVSILSNKYTNTSGRYIVDHDIDVSIDDIDMDLCDKIYIAISSCEPAD